LWDGGVSGIWWDSPLCHLSEGDSGRGSRDRSHNYALRLRDPDSQVVPTYCKYQVSIGSFSCRAYFNSW